VVVVKVVVAKLVFLGEREKEPPPPPLPPPPAYSTINSAHAENFKMITTTKILENFGKHRDSVIASFHTIAESLIVSSDCTFRK